jgi:N-acetylmuramic acid 6-phosphate etherase
VVVTRDLAGPDSTLVNFETLVTEGRDPGNADLDLRSTAELVELMNRQDASVPAVVAAAAPDIAAAIDAVSARFAAGGRLVYAGAGTSGGIAALDAAECEATFSTPRGRVLALVAGGAWASATEQAAAEDDEDAGREAVVAAGVGAQDAVVAVSASGRTPYALGALRAAREAGAATVCVVSVADSVLAELADHAIAVPVGPELIAGSTRLKAGTAQKLVLNTISTVCMIRCGKTFGDLMVDVVPTNAKLRARSRRTVLLATNAPPDAVDAALEASHGSAKVAIVSLLAGIEADAARARLDAAEGSVRRALG